MNAEGFGVRLKLLQAAPAILLALVAILFTSVSPRFLTLENAENILSQSAYVAIVAIGMTFVMLIAGIDLSVGATMYVSAAVVGLGFPTLPAPLVLLAMAAIGAVFGAINALFIAGLRIAAFIATLAMLFIGRGLALYLSDTKMVFAGDPVLEFGQGAFLGVPFSIWVLLAIFALSL
jgi:ribose transport system permease protein